MLKAAHYMVFVLDRICRSHQKGVLVSFRVQAMLMMCEMGVAFTLFHSLFIDLRSNANFLAFLVITIPTFVWLNGKLYKDFAISRPYTAEFKAYGRATRMLADVCAISVLLAGAMSPVLLKV